MEITNLTIKDISALTKFLEKNEMADLTAVDRLRFVVEGRQNFSYIAYESEEVEKSVEDRKIVGCVIAITDGFKGYLNKLVVDAEYRQHGLGKKLVNKAVESLQLAGCQEVIILCKPFLANWYESQGFVKDETSILYKKELTSNKTDCNI